MSLLRIPRNPSNRQLAVFAATWALFFAALGSWAWDRCGTAWAAGLWCAAVVVPVLGWRRRSVLRAAYLAAAYAAWPFGFVLSHLLLAAVFYLVVTPLGMLLRAFGYDPLTVRIDRRSTSYWTERSADESVESHFRQF